jgi:pyruvate dehydrogenase E1 component alpha subunit
MKTAVERARRGDGPTLVECKTTRWERHSAISAGKYENEEEAMKWKRNDPIPRFGRVLQEKGATETQLKEIQERAKKMNDEALDFAIRSEPPKPQTVGDLVYA